MTQEILIPTPKPIIPENRCERCRFATLHKDKQYNCHRHPPTVQAFPAQSGFIIHTFHPIVLDINFCGEFKIKPSLSN